MREHLVKLLLDRVLPEIRPDEDFFSAGPRPVTRQPMDRAQQNALIADFRRQLRHTRAA